MTDKITFKYLYGMRLRGFAPGCQPMDGFIERSDMTYRFVNDSTRVYHDVLVYSRPLSDKELRDYELDFISREHVAFRDTSSNAVLDRFNNLKAMDTILRSGNDEGIYYAWINVIPDQAEDEDFMDVAKDQPDTYAEACGLFMRLMRSKAIKEGGLYIGEEVFEVTD